MHALFLIARRIHGDLCCPCCSKGEQSTTVMSAAIVQLLVPLVHVASMWMGHIDRRQSHLVQPSPRSMTINCLVSVSVSWCPGVILVKMVQLHSAKFAVITYVVSLSAR